MGTNLFIGRRFLKIYKGSFSGPVIRIATTGIALSMAVMIVAVVIVKGFQLEIRNKVIGFSGHVRVKPFQMSAVDQQIPLNYERDDIQLLRQNIRGLVSIQPSAEKAGIIKSDDQIEGCIFKGVNHDYYTGFLDAALTEGHFPRIGTDTVSNEIIISRITASRLNFKTGDDLRMYFLLPGESQPRGRKFRITGIYDTGLFEFDKKYMFGDLGHLQRLNQWENNEAGVIEILVDDYRNMTSTAEMAGQILHYDLEVWDVRELYPEIFNWLDLLDMNVTVIIVIMLVVAMINIITILLIRILEKTSAIGIMKSFGASNHRVRMIFLYISSLILIRGMVFGNIIGMGIALLQQHTGLITLDQDTYYVSTVPVHFDLMYLAGINLMVFTTGVFFMVLPSMIVSRIYPARTLRI